MTTLQAQQAFRPASFSPHFAQARPGDLPPPPRFLGSTEWKLIGYQYYTVQYHLVVVVESAWLCVVSSAYSCAFKEEGGRSVLFLFGSIKMAEKRGRNFV